MTRARALWEKVLRSALQCLVENDGPMRRRDVVEWIAEHAEFDAWEWAPTGKKGLSRWRTSGFWATPAAVKAGIMTKSGNGDWEITQAGREALGLSPADLMDLCHQAHMEYMEARQDDEREEVTGRDRLGACRGQLFFNQG